jgi:hypothetical protein
LSHRSWRIHNAIARRFAIAHRAAPFRRRVDATDFFRQRRFERPGVGANIKWNLCKYKTEFILRTLV